MNEQKGLFTRLAETVDQYFAERRAAAPEQAPSRRKGMLHWFGRQMIPNIGTLILVAVMLFTIPSLAAPRGGIEAMSTSVISYQGRLADNAGNPLTGSYNMEFRIYETPEGGTPLWEEYWTGGNWVAVSDGLFNVLLGSLNTNLQAAIQGRSELYLGITVGTDSEMWPRVQLGSVPFSMQAMTVSDGAITTAKLADDAVTNAKMADSAVGSAEVIDQSLTNYDLGPDSVGNSEMQDDAVGSAEVIDQSLTNYDLGPDSVGYSEMLDNACH